MFNFGFKKVGGIWHWHLGRIGGSFYVTSRETWAKRQQEEKAKRLARAIAADGSRKSFHQALAYARARIDLESGE